MTQPPSFMNRCVFPLSLPSGVIKYSCQLHITSSGHADINYDLSDDILRSQDIRLNSGFFAVYLLLTGVCFVLTSIANFVDLSFHLLKYACQERMEME